MKGSIDLVVLIMGSVAMILLLVLSGIFMQGEVNSDLYAETVFQEGRYQVIASTGQLLRPEVRRDIGMYPVESGAEKQQIEQRITDNVTRIYGYQSENYLFSVDDLEISGDVSARRLGTNVLVASPSRDDVRVHAELGDSQ